MKSKSLTLVSLLLVGVMLLLAACGPAPTPQVIEKEVVVEKPAENWEQRLLELRESGVSPESEPEVWEEVLRGLFDTGPEPEEAETVIGYVYEFEVSDDNVQLTFPEKFGGQTVNATLKGEFDVFVEEQPAEITAARMFSFRTEYEIRGISFQLGSEDIDLGPFLLTTSMFDFSGVGPDSPQGLINLETGEFRMTFTLNLAHPTLESLGIDNPGTIVYDEQGIMDLQGEKGYLEASGTVIIDNGPFEGTRISFSPMIGRTKHSGDTGGSKSATYVANVFLKPYGPGCGTYGGTEVGTKSITGKGVSPNYQTSFKQTYIQFQGVSNWYQQYGPLWSNKWNGKSIAGFWHMVHSTYGKPCKDFPPKASISVELPSGGGISTKTHSLKVPPGLCAWVKVGVQKSHQTLGPWCADGSFLTQFDLDGDRDQSAHDAPIVGQARCCAPQQPQEPKWGSCFWVKVGPQKSHQTGAAWCADGSFLTQFDLDGDRDLSAHDAPIVGQARCCAPQQPQEPKWGSCSWVKVGVQKSHQTGAAWCADGSFLTQFDLDGDRDLSAHDAPIVGQARCCTLKQP